MSRSRSFAGFGEVDVSWGMGTAFIGLPGRFQLFSFPLSRSAGLSFSDGWGGDLPDASKAYTPITLNGGSAIGLLGLCSRCLLRRCNNPEIESG